MPKSRLKDVKIGELVFNEEGTDKIAEVFGVNQDVANKVENLFVKWLAFEEHETLTVAFADFVKSDVFAKTGMKLETANDYFVLGMAFANGLDKFRSKMRGAGRSGGMDILAELLSHAEVVHDHKG